jgi:hypothetical protein
VSLLECLVFNVLWLPTPLILYPRLEKSLREQYLNILNLEEDFWALKSRVGWVVEGDRNTNFSTLPLLSVEAIIRLLESEIVWGIGLWISQLISQHIQKGF